ATTDPQKLPITVISRCLQFTLRPLAVDEITEHLGNILTKESIQADQDAIWQIAESAQGSLRDALSLTDQAIAYGQGAIQHQDVKDMLGLIDRTIIYDLILAIHQNQKARVSELLLQFRQQALDVSLVLDQLISTLHELALLQYLPDLSLKYSAEINQKIMQLSALISAQALQLYYQIACKGRADLQLAVTQEQGFEMTVLRLLAFRPLQPNEIPTNTAQIQQAVPAASAPQQNQITQQESAPVAQAAVEDFSLDDDYEDDQDDNPVTAQSELSSDDFLDEDEPETNSEPQVIQAESTRVEQSESEQIVFDPNLEDGLFGFDDVPAEPVPSSPEASSDDFLLEEFIPENDTAAPVEQEPEFNLDASTPGSERVIRKADESQPEISTQTEAASTQIANTNISTDRNLMPQDILQIPVQNMQGEWTVEKWEFWFRNSQLSPAVQELAQYGIMTGQINAASVFHIPERYQPLLSQLQHHLEAALREQWPQTIFQVKFEDVEQLTPYTMQQERKVRAFKRAEELLQAEPAIRDLLEQFDGELHNIQLK
ncbi:DNA polymerase III subunit gamma/tau, partial [Acinetobacter variabilis]|uniref:DNA polymerase III subunit gamma/tau n=1 Tax=Acinetobacter variabilis TaxID=70346 RepID=UPI0028A21AF5